MSLTPSIMPRRATHRDRGRRRRSRGPARWSAGREGAGEHHVVGRGRDQHLLVGGRRRCSHGRDEARADIGKVAAERDRRAQRTAVADPPASTIGPARNWCTARANAKGSSQPGRPPAPRSRARGRRRRGERALGAPDPGDVGEDERTGLMQRADDAGRRATLVMTISGAWASTTARSSARRGFEACTMRFGQQAAAAVPVASSRSRTRLADGCQPLAKLLGRAAFGGRKGRSRYAAGGDDEIDAGDAEHRRRDQRQGHPPRIGRSARPQGSGTPSAANDPSRTFSTKTKAHAAGEDCGTEARPINTGRNVVRSLLTPARPSVRRRSRCSAAIPRMAFAWDGGTLELIGRRTT